MASLITREVPGTNCTVKGAPLSNAEVDNDFIALNNDLATKAPLISPSFTTPVLGTPTSGDLSNCTGTANGLTAGNVSGTVAVANGGTGSTTTDAAKVALDIQTSSTGSIKFPIGTTAQRDAGLHPGYMRFNSETSQFEGHNGTAWTSVGGSAISNDITTATNLYPIFVNATTGTALNVYTSSPNYLYKPSTGELSSPHVIATNGIMLNNSTITANYTIVSGTNGMSIGPITMSPGISVTITSGQRWVVL